MSKHTCNCNRMNCGCAGGMHTYAPYYQALLNIIKPAKVHEWGPGPNTQMALDSGAWVTAVESDREWLPKGTHERFSCIWIPTSHPLYTSTWQTTDTAQTELFFVDGRRRGECLNAIPFNSTAIACLHDAQRLRYQEPMSRFPFVIHLIFGFAIMSFDEGVNRIAEQIRKEVQ